GRNSRARRIFRQRSAAVLRLRLRLQWTSRRIGARARLAGGRHGRAARRRRLDYGLAHRPLAGEQVLDLVAGERLELEQALGQELEIGVLLIENLFGLRVASFDQAPDLGVDLAARLLRDVLLARYLIAEEHLVLVLAVGDGAKLVGEAPARHHHAGKLRGLLDIGSRTRGDLFP